MKKKIAIVGFGRAGQRFFAYLKKKNNIKIIKIIVKNKRNIFFRNKNIGGTFADIKNLGDVDGPIYLNLLHEKMVSHQLFISTPP